MTVQSKPFFWLTCDVCGARYPTEDDEYSAYSDLESVVQYAEEEGYWEVEGGNHVCDDCKPHPPDWDDDHEAFAEGRSQTLDCKWCEADRKGERVQP